MLIQILIVLFLLALTAFLLLWIFGKLVNLKIFSVMNWAFHTCSDSKHCEKLLPFSATFCYIIAFLFLYAGFYLLPMRISYIDENNAGGLLGYNKDGNHMVYDPSKDEYVGYFWFDAPFPVTKFTETFEIVSFFKLPSKNYYQSIASLSWGNSLALIIMGLLFLVLTYLMLYLTSREFVKYYNLPDKISHSSIAHHFKSFLRITPLNAFVIILLLTSLFLFWNSKSVNKVKNHYHDLYASDRQNLRNELLGNVSPGDTLIGLVMSGYQYRVAQTEKSYDERVKKPSEKTGYQAGFSYVVEFNNLLRIPVYLTLITPVALGNVIEASKYSGDREKVVPDFLKEYTFIVNKDYSVSLKND